MRSRLKKIAFFSLIPSGRRCVLGRLTKKKADNMRANEQLSRALSRHLSRPCLYQRVDLDLSHRFCGV